MKSLKSAFIIATLSIPGWVIADNTTPDKPVEKWTCAEFIGMDEQFRPKVVYWASAHAKSGKKQHGRVLNIEGTEQVIPIVIDECTQDSKASFWQKLKVSWNKAETAAKDELKEIKSDLGDIKTNMMNKTTQ